MERFWALKSEQHSVIHFNFPGPQFSHLENRNNINAYSRAFKRLKLQNIRDVS